MSHLLYWPSKYYFYPIGNTSAISLTADLPNEASAEILLLGCGDPRNVLYTIFNEPDQSTRQLDFTCCDFDPGVLARNILLLSMIIDDQPIDVLWNTFFHFRLDKKTKSALLAQCDKLIDLSHSPDQWRSSIYASSIRMCTDYTLSEVRRHWKLYIDMQDLPEAQRKEVLATFKQLSIQNSQRINASAVRSAGPLVTRAGTIATQSYQNYWKTGTTFFDAKRVSEATEPNPTFVYSLGVDGSSFHYGTDPLAPFHLAPVIASAKGNVTVSDVTKGAKEEFSTWCIAYHRSYISERKPIIRFIIGEASAVCQALHSYHTTGTLRLGLPVAQWKTSLLRLNPDEYTTSGACAPSSFNVVHTSNLEDHIGLFNVIIATRPLLSPSPFTVVYTESLLHIVGDATKEFTENMKADITAMGLLTGLVPVNYLCGFSSRSNTHELTMHGPSARKKAAVTQFHQVTTWKAPTSGDVVAAPQLDRVLLPSFDPYQLGTFLYDVYQALFEQETSTKFFMANRRDTARAVSASNLTSHYTREAFVLFLKLVKSRLHAPHEVWTSVMDRFSALQLAAWSLMSMDTLHYQDLCSQLLRHSVYRAHWLHHKARKIGPFSTWESVPDLVRIVLVIPRTELRLLEESKAEEIGTPPLHCDIFGDGCHNIFTSVHVAFGRAVKVGDSSRPQVIFEEDIKGWKGSSPLVASFIVPAHTLVEIEPPSNLSVGFCVRNTPAACMTLIPKLGMSLRISTAKLLDSSRVFILPENTLPSRYSPSTDTCTLSASSQSPSPLLTQIGTASTSSVDFDEQCELIVSLTARISLEDTDSIQQFCSEGSKVVPEISQHSPCIIRVALVDRAQDIVFPFPVQSTGHRLRLARKSKYIEVIVSPSRSFLPDGMKLNPYPVVSHNAMVHPWSIHRVNLTKLPIHTHNTNKYADWYASHVGSMLSKRERSLRRKHKHDALLFVKDTIHSIFLAIVNGPAKGTRLFSLVDDQTNNSDTILFISEIRFDLAFHTLVCDGYVLPLTKPFLDMVAQPFGNLVQRGKMANLPVFDGELQSWKQLLPALVERCRTSWTHGPNCEYKSHSRIPLTEKIEEDPLCSCGKGMDAEGMHKNPLWKPFAPYVTRIALSPLFAVSYLETVGRSPERRKCAACRGNGKPTLKECSGCKKVRYCSPECQKKDWKLHKPKCQRK